MRRAEEISGGASAGHRATWPTMGHAATPGEVRRLRLAALLGAGLLTGGRLLDLWWHSTHHDFERGVEQVQAHWLAWLGALVLGGTAALAVRRHVSRTPGFLVILSAALAYAAVAVWHFSLHQRGQDPDLPHVLLGLSQVGLYAGALLVVAGLLLPSCRQRYIFDRLAPPG